MRATCSNVYTRSSPAPKEGHEAGSAESRGLGHALPFVIANFRTVTLAAIAVVTVEHGRSRGIHNRYMDTPLLSAAFQVVEGGLLVFSTGIPIGNS